MLSTKCIFLRLGLVQIYSVAEPVYGSSPYTAREKKLDGQEPPITGAGIETKNEHLDAIETSPEDKSESDPVLDDLNSGKKQKLASGIYSSFMHPRLQTGTMTFERKRKLPVPTSEGAKKPFGSTKQAKFDSEKVKHKFQFV